MLFLSSNYAILAVSLFVIIIPLTTAHQGHDHHGHGEQQNEDLNPEDAIPETDKDWTDPAIHSIPFNGLTLKWKQDEKDARSVIMKISSKTVGWVAVGFCVIWTGTMDKCDIILGWVDAGGIAHLYVRTYFIKHLIN